MANVYCCTLGSDLEVIDAVTGAAVATVLMGAGMVSYMAAVSPDGNWVAVTSGTDKLQFVATATNTTSGAVITTGISANVCGVCWAPDSSKAYVQGTNAVRSCTPAGTLGTLWTVTGAHLGDMTISPDGAHLYCTCTADVKQVDTTSGAVTATYAMPSGNSYGICISPDGTKVYVSDAHVVGHVYQVDVASGTISGGAPLGGGEAYGLAISPDGSRLWACEFSSNQVEVILVSAMAITDIITVPHANEIAVTPDGARVWVSDFIDGRVYPINAATLTVGTYAFVGGNAQGVAIQPAGPPPATASANLAVGPVAVEVGSGGSAGFPPIIGAPTVTGAARLDAGPVTVTAADFAIVGTGHVAFHIGPVRVAVIGGRTGPGGFPVVAGRGRWRLTLHRRPFTPATLTSTIVAELADARGRRLEQNWNTPASLTFTLDGRAQTATLVEELIHDVVAWRWDDQTGTSIPVFHGPITQSEDQLTEDSHTVTYICHDYAALLTRRLITTTYSVTGRDQDLIAGDLLSLAKAVSMSSGTSLSPACFFSLGLLAVHPNGSLRGLSGQNRNRTYYGSQNIGAALDDLAKIDSGFDYDVVPSAVDDHDNLRIFYPAQGVTRADVALQYGSTVANLTRSVNSADYANYVRVLGNNQSANPTPQAYGEAAASGAATTPAGIWMTANDAADVTTAAALTEKAVGDIALGAVLTPSYTLNLTPGAYTWGHPNMGDTVPLLIQSGRLDVNTTVRVLGIAYDIGDDGQEDVTLTVSRPPTKFSDFFNRSAQDIRSLARR